MTIKKLIYGSSLVLFGSISTYAQNAFLNLNFEKANPVVDAGSPYYPYGVTAASALPDWTVTIGGVQQTDITENDPSLGAPWVMLVHGNDGFGDVALDGNYSVLLQGGVTASAASISQTGLIPAGTQSLLFEAQPNDAGPAGTLEFLVGTQVVPFAAVATEPNYTLYGANISAWANQTEKLTFSATEGVYGITAIRSWRKGPLVSGYNKVICA